MRLSEHLQIFSHRAHILFIVTAFNLFHDVVYNDSRFLELEIRVASLSSLGKRLKRLLTDKQLQQAVLEVATESAELAEQVVVVDPRPHRELPELGLENAVHLEIVGEVDDVDHGADAALRDEEPTFAADIFSATFVAPDQSVLFMVLQRIQHIQLPIAPINHDVHPLI